MIMISTPTVEQLAAMLYHLDFPRKEFADLPKNVQRAFISDADRLLTMMKANV